MCQWWSDGFDLLLTPTLGEPPPKIGDLVPPADNPLAGLAKVIGLIPFTPPFNLTGQPAISVPAGFGEDGLPTNAHIVAKPLGEDTLLQLASQLEVARPPDGRRPMTATA